MRILRLVGMKDYSEVSAIIRIFCDQLYIPITPLHPPAALAVFLSVASLGLCCHCPPGAMAMSDDLIAISLGDRIDPPLEAEGARFTWMEDHCELMISLSGLRSAEVKGVEQGVSLTSTD